MGTLLAFNHDGTTSKTIITCLTAGQSVWLETTVYADADIESNQFNKFTTFSGVLLYSKYIVAYHDFQVIVFQQGDSNVYFIDTCRKLSFNYHLIPTLFSLDRTKLPSIKQVYLQEATFSVRVWVDKVENNVKGTLKY